MKVLLPKVREGFLTVFLKVELHFRLKEIMSLEIFKKRRFAAQAILWNNNSNFQFDQWSKNHHALSLHSFCLELKKNLHI